MNHADFDFGAVESVEIFFDDLDAMGVVHNARYGLLLERALGTYWARNGWVFDPNAPHFDEIFFVVRDFSIRYHRPIVSVGQVAVHFWIAAMDETSVGYRFRVLSEDGSVVHADGSRSGVKVDRHTFRRSALSDAVRAACEPLLVPELLSAASAAPA